jgi:hypothetical protein
MMTRRPLTRTALSLTLAVVALAAAVAGAGRAQAPGVEAAFGAFWAAPSVPEAVAAAPAIVQSGVDFETALARLRGDHDQNAPRGIAEADAHHGSPPYLHGGRADHLTPKKCRCACSSTAAGPARPVTAAMDRSARWPARNNLRAAAGVGQAPWWGPLQDVNVPAILDQRK